MKRLHEPFASISLFCKETIVSSAFIVALLTLTIFPVHAQDTPMSQDSKASQTDNLYYQQNTVSGHSLQLNGFGLEYSYEYAFTPRGTILFNVGTSYTYGLTLGLDVNSSHELNITTKDYHLVSGDLSVEPRFYYNLRKRYRNERRTLENSGGYVALNLGYAFPIAISNGWEAPQLYNMTAWWGFRRVWRHFFFEMAAGTGYYASSNGSSGVLPTFRLGLGYRF